MLNELTSAVNKDCGRLIETGVEVGLKWSYVLSQVEEPMQVCTNVNESCARHKVWMHLVKLYLQSTHIHLHEYTSLTHSQ